MEKNYYIVRPVVATFATLVQAEHVQTSLHAVCCSSPVTHQLTTPH